MWTCHGILWTLLIISVSECHSIQKTFNHKIDIFSLRLSPTYNSMSGEIKAMYGHSEGINGSEMTILSYENLQITKRSHRFRIVVAQVCQFRVCVRFFRANRLAKHCTRIIWAGGKPSTRFPLEEPVGQKFTEFMYKCNFCTVKWRNLKVS